jgi:uncharacterized Zn finger protein (UPF0148 family)
MTTRTVDHRARRHGTAEARGSGRIARTPRTSVALGDRIAGGFSFALRPEEGRAKVDQNEWTCPRCGAGTFEREELEDGTVRCHACRVRDERRAEREAQRAAREAATKRSGRIASADDVGPALAEVMAAAEQDERLTPNALRLLVVLHKAARVRGWVEMTAARWWIAEASALAQPVARRALDRLLRFDYAQAIKPGEVRSDALRSWLRKRETGRPPTLVRLATRPPKRDEVGQNPRPKPPEDGGDARGVGQNPRPKP